MSTTAFTQEKKSPNLTIPESLKSIVPYGTFEYALGGNKLGWGVVDIIPRVGLKGQWAIDELEDYYVFSTAELGLQLTQRNDHIKISSDPGTGFGKVNSAVFARQGFIGIGSPYGRFSVGKQWGVHYTLAGAIDDMYIFGGDAIGVYNAGTDGGISGTGRADQAAKYELFKGNFYFGFQAQFRNISDNDKYFADAFSTAAYYEIPNIIKLGISYSKVMDGMLKPEPNQAAIDDEMLSVLIDHKDENFHFGIMGMVFNNHEKSNDGIFFKGWGVEYSLKYNFGTNKRWAFVNNSSIMIPNSDQNLKYILNTYSFELARRFSKNAAIIAGLKYDNSTLNNGEQKNILTYALGFYYNFNYPVP